MFNSPETHGETSFFNILEKVSPPNFHLFHIRGEMVIPPKCSTCSYFWGTRKKCEEVYVRLVYCINYIDIHIILLTSTILSLNKHKQGEAFRALLNANSCFRNSFFPHGFQKNLSKFMSNCPAPSLPPPPINQKLIIPGIRY